MRVDFEDRALAHVQLIVGAKLRRRESFFLSWTENIESGSGRSSLWIETAILLHFQYTSPNQVQINRDWLDLLRASADSSQGLKFHPEPGVQNSRRSLPRSYA